MDMNPDNPEVLGLSVSWHAVTHRGLVRRQNEDSFCVSRQEHSDGLRYLIAVADGLGGYRSGSIASKMAMESVRREFTSWRSGPATGLLRRAVRQANDVLFSAAQSRYEFSEMQTTITSVVLEDSRMAVAHVGDCRLYRLREGRMDLLTRDHTAAGQIIPLPSHRSAGDTQGRHKLTRSLGGQPFIRVDIFGESIADKDTYLLCTDGLWSTLPEGDIRSALVYSATPEEACKELLGLTLSHGGGDNLSAVVFGVSCRIKAGRQRPPLFSFRHVRN